MFVRFHERHRKMYGDVFAISLVEIYKSQFYIDFYSPNNIIYLYNFKNIFASLIYTYLNKIIGFFMSF